MVDNLLAGHIIARLNSEKWLILGKLKSNVISAIPLVDGSPEGMIGGGIDPNTILEVLKRLSEDELANSLSQAGVMNELTARTKYNE